MSLNTNNSPSFSKLVTAAFCPFYIHGHFCFYDGCLCMQKADNVAIYMHGFVSMQKSDDASLTVICCFCFVFYFTVCDEDRFSVPKDGSTILALIPVLFFIKQKPDASPRRWLTLVFWVPKHIQHCTCWIFNCISHHKHFRIVTVSFLLWSFAEYMLNGKWDQNFLFPGGSGTRNLSTSSSPMSTLSSNYKGAGSSFVTDTTTTTTYMSGAGIASTQVHIYSIIY